MRRFASGYSAAREERDRALFREAFACMDASNETIERVMAMAQQLEDADKSAARARGTHVAGNATAAGGAAARGRGHKRGRGQRGRITVRAALATAAATALIASGAYAAASTDFFQTAFGPKGNPDVEARTMTEEGYVNPVTGEPKSWINPGRTWEDVDEQVAERLLGAYVADINQSVELDGYTLTVEQCVMDENGNGVATFTLENPAGLEMNVSEYGEASLSAEASVYIDVAGAGEGAGMWDSRIVGDVASSTATAFRGAFYFGPFDGAVGEGLTWTLTERYVEYGAERRTSETISFKPATTVPVRELVAWDGTSVELSPLALVVHGPIAGVPDGGSYLTTGVAVRYGDGSEYVVLSSSDSAAGSAAGQDAVENSIVSFRCKDDGATVRVFNRLVDVDAVVSVVLTGSVCEVVDGVVELAPATELVYTAR